MIDAITLLIREVYKPLFLVPGTTHGFGSLILEFFAGIHSGNHHNDLF
jgi:hypothetical protein